MIVSLQMLGLKILVIIYMFWTKDTNKILQLPNQLEVEINFDVVVPNDIIGYAFVSTDRLVSISSDGQRLLALI